MSALDSCSEHSKPVSGYHHSSTSHREGWNLSACYCELVGSPCLKSQLPPDSMTNPTYAGSSDGCSVSHRRLGGGKMPPLPMPTSGKRRARSDLGRGHTARGQV